MKKFKPRLRTKNYSCEPLKAKNGNIRSFPVRSIVRLGSTTESNHIIRSFKTPFVEINTVESIQNSRSKLLMKDAFKKANIPQSKWWKNSIELNKESEISFPILAKRVFGFKGKGMVKIDNKEDLVSFIKNNNLSGYYFEEFHNYAREYRVHCTPTEAFLCWRKLRRKEATERWYFNSSNCVWVGESNKLFDAPSNFEQIKKDCIKALNSVGLDIGAVDVRVQSSKNPKYIILEVNSAPSLGDKGNEYYAKKIQQRIATKINEKKFSIIK